MTEDAHGSSGGVELTEERVRRLADDAERGYHPEELRRRRGRPPLGREAASVFHVRLEPRLRAALDRRADEDATTASEIVRRALREYLGTRSSASDTTSNDGGS